MRWFGHLERKSGVSACRNVEVIGETSRGMKTWSVCVYNMKLLGLQSAQGSAQGYEERLHIGAKRLTLAERGRNEQFQNKC